ncbi:hypothetical protein NCAS_0G01010 [Naumovozyma castellii]|uniref:G1/S-specific cyclin n=1 Tax=Naumovozyma castellii TaxID=27288 RepID=G0VHV4_NAUCA|nr:hypothetical protein NCAS_0G01010 [Naumovozyma castellii CBS 4309]CCC70988.1 hypothetical protein NCAS_0G01010 [Naumovozyma castellii CBS 4309]
MSSTESGMGLIVTAQQTYYPINLSNAELLSHYETLQEYHEDVSAHALQQSNKYKPTPKLIDQQPEMPPQETRTQIVTFLYELSVMTRVTHGIFSQAVRLYDRYCSKRVVLKDQSKLVIATCLWLTAKTWGGCNHIINNVVIPTGGRFFGPNPRARIPRLSELVHYCNGINEGFDESMFCQMEMHILDTLNWEITEPLINDYVLNVDENCLMQYELYQRQVDQEKQQEWKRQSQTSQESDATVDDNSSANTDNEDLTTKIQIINLKKFLVDLASWQYDLLNFETYEVALGICSIINKFTNQEQSSFLITPMTQPTNQIQLLNIFITAVINAPSSLIQIYKEQAGITTFVAKVKSYHLELQKKLQLASDIELQRKLTLQSCYSQQEIPTTTQYSNTSSPVYPSQNYTPMRNVSAQSESSVFSTAMEHSSPMTPTMYYFNKINNSNTNGSSISINSLPNPTGRQSYDPNDKENQIPNDMTMPPRVKFINTGVSHSPLTNMFINSDESNSRLSLNSMPVETNAHI